MTRSRVLVIGLLAVSSFLLGAPCGELPPPVPPPDPIRVTLNAIPADENALLVVPPSGFTVDVDYGYPESVDPSTLRVMISPLDHPDWIDISYAAVRSDPDGAVVVVPPEANLEPGSHTVLAYVIETSGSVSHSASLEFAIREPQIPAPLKSHQWIQLDFDADRDGNGLPDFPDDLKAFGLGSAAGPGASAIVCEWAIDEVVARVQEYYDLANPSQLPGGDAANVSFHRDPPPSGVYTRICVGGGDPTGGVTMGNVVYDAGNANPADVACDNFLPSGVFPREIIFWSAGAPFKAAFDAVIGHPVGTHPLDDVVLGPEYDPGDPDQLERFEAIQRGVEAFAQVTASITAHEAGHSLGLVAPGPPGGGLFGGASGANYTHNVTPEGTTPSESYLMNAGNTFNFATLGGSPTVALPRIRSMNWAYLRGRLLLDAAVDGIYLAPIVNAVQPATISLSGPSWVDVTILGQNFQGTPTLRLLGPVNYTLSSPTLVDDAHVTAGIVTFQVLAGSYELEFTNGDGQTTTRWNAVTVVP